MLRDATSSRFAVSSGRLGWLSSRPGSSWKGAWPVESAIECSTAVGDLTGDVTNADLMNVFRKPNLGLRGDSPGLVAPFHLCCNAKAMFDSSALKANRDGDGGRWER